LYSIKEGVLNELIANGTPDGIHSFPTGDIRRVYKLGQSSNETIEKNKKI
jgi:hypothetical protein